MTFSYHKQEHQPLALVIILINNNYRNCNPFKCNRNYNDTGTNNNFNFGKQFPHGLYKYCHIACSIYGWRHSNRGFINAGALPAGLNGVYNAGAKTFTISGTPTVAGVFNYTITTSGTCTGATATGTITVQEQTIVLTSGSATQAVCINDPIASVVYTVGGTATGAGVTGLPAGVTGFYSGGSFIISGTPTASGTFNYTVTTTGTCSPAAVATGTITVNPAASISFSSAVGTDAQTLCINAPITDITYLIGGGGADASASGLPTGVTGSFSGNTFTITGTPTVAGTFTYTVTTTGTCAQTSAIGTITVQEQTIVLTSGSASPTLCVGSTLTNIVYTIGGTATGVTLTGPLPTGITGSLSGTTYTISGSPSQLGTFPYTITTTGSCSPAASVSGTVIVNSGSVGGTVTPAAPAICSGGGGTLNLTGQTGNIVRWESSINGGGAWTNIANTTSTLNYVGVTVPTIYRALVKSGSCTGVYSSVAAVAIKNYWTGAIDDDWNTAGNWSDSQVPTTACDVYIPNTPNKPVLSGAPTATITNIHILAGAKVTVDGTGLMQIAGTIFNAGTFDVSAGALEFNGSGSQNINGSMFAGNTLMKVIISNTGTGLGLTGPATDTLKIAGSVSFGNVNGKVFNTTTGGHLTLMSGISGTASVGDLTNGGVNSGNDITGDVTVERYIATGSVHAKSWQLLAIPTVGQNIKDAWQEGATAATGIGALPPGANPHPGYGIMITSAVANAVSQPSPGFDYLTTAGPSMKTYVYATNDYDAGPSSTQNAIYNQKGYVVLVRGDRSVNTSTAPANPTTLRTTGRLFTSTSLATTPPSTTVVATKFESIGNPYASAINIERITKSGVDEFIFLWDPQLGGAYSLGAYVTFSHDIPNHRYVPTPASPTYPGPITDIQSGQAFLMQATASNGTVSFTESAKSIGSALVTSPVRNPRADTKLVTNLYALEYRHTAACRWGAE